MFNLASIRTLCLYSQRPGCHQRSLWLLQHGSVLHFLPYDMTCSKGGTGSRYHMAGGNAEVWAASPMSAGILAGDFFSWPG